MSYPDNAPPPIFEIPMPNILSGNQPYNNLHGKTENVQYPVKKEKAWVKLLYAAICWLLYALHFVIVSTFFVELFRGEYDIAKHITIVATICGTYMALAYVHNNIMRYDGDGRLD